MLFDAELASGTVSPEAVLTPPVLDALRVRAAPSRPRRLMQGIHARLVTSTQRGPAPSAREIDGRQVTRAIEQPNGLWLPIVMHWGWEADADWGDLERLVDVVGLYAVHWDDFLAAVERSR